LQIVRAGRGDDVIDLRIANVVGVLRHRGCGRQVGPVEEAIVVVDQQLAGGVAEMDHAVQSWRAAQ
jgi:hypothetical protein